jgi:predicted AlkP superfamily phosphohydrolase/phosphomutase
MGDLQSCVRLNLRGREAQGIVEPGREQDDLSCRIVDGLISFVDADTGLSPIEAIVPGDRLYPDAKTQRDMPDLVIRWTDTPAVEHRALVSPQYGRIDWPTPGKMMDGRSGHHGPQGWILAGGPGIEPGSEMPDAHVFDFNATIHRLLGVPQPEGMLGRLIPALTVPVLLDEEGAMDRNG